MPGAKCSLINIVWTDVLQGKIFLQLQRTGGPGVRGPLANRPDVVRQFAQMRDMFSAVTGNAQLQNRVPADEN